MKIGQLGSRLSSRMSGAVFFDCDVPEQLSDKQELLVVSSERFLDFYCVYYHTKKTMG